MKLQDFDINDATEKQWKDHLLFLSWAHCDHYDKSTEFTLQFMADYAEVDYDDAVEFMVNRSDDRQQWYDTYPNWLEDLHEMLNEDNQ